MTGFRNVLISDHVQYYQQNLKRTATNRISSKSIPVIQREERPERYTW
jgi:hypothetical protein